MKVSVNVECSPEEARAFLGLPDVSSVNELLVNETRARFEKNLELVDPVGLMRQWTAMGGAMTDQFMTMMTQAARAGAGEDENGET